MMREHNRVAGIPGLQRQLLKAVCLVMVVHIQCLAVSAQLRSDQEVKAAYVFNLTKYVEWPHRRDELVIGYIGDDDSMGLKLRKTLAGNKTENRAIRIVLFPSGDVLERCDLLYIAYSKPAKIHAVLEQLRNTSTLTIGDTDWFAKQGGMIGLVTTGGQVRIEVNLQAAQVARLAISSRLLNLSTIVHPSGARN